MPPASSCFSVRQVLSREGGDESAALLQLQREQLAPLRQLVSQRAPRNSAQQRTDDSDLETALKDTSQSFEVHAGS